MEIGKSRLRAGAGLLWPANPGAFRLWLAMVVVAHHITRLEIGKAPVLVFFALSGYWVHRVWHGRYAGVRAPWLTFVISRWWRIVPLLLVASVLSLLTHALCRDADWALIQRQPVAQALLPFGVLGYAQLATRPVGPAWSLDIEMQFYLLAPLLIAMVAHWRVWAVLAFGYACFVASLALGWGVVLPAFLIFFLIGLLAAQHAWRAPPPLANGGMLMAIGTVLLCGLLPDAHAWLGEGGANTAMLNLGLAICLLPFALGTVSRPSDAADRAMGDFSYIAYLMHWPVIIGMRFAGWGAGLSLLGFGVMAAFSFALWRWLDRPLDGLRARWVAGQGRAGEVPRRKRGDSPTHFA